MDGIFFNGLKPLNDAIFSILKHKGLHQFSRFVPYNGLFMQRGFIVRQDKTIA